MMTSASCLQDQDGVGTGDLTSSVAIANHQTYLANCYRHTWRQSAEFHPCDINLLGDEPQISDQDHNGSNVIVMRLRGRWHHTRHDIYISPWSSLSGARWKLELALCNEWDLGLGWFVIQQYLCHSLPMVIHPLYDSLKHLASNLPYWLNFILVSFTVCNQTVNMPHVHMSRLTIMTD